LRMMSRDGLLSRRMRRNTVCAELGGEGIWSGPSWKRKRVRLAEKTPRKLSGVCAWSKLRGKSSLSAGGKRADI